MGVGDISELLLNTYIAWLSVYLYLGEYLNSQS